MKPVLARTLGAFVLAAGFVVLTSATGATKEPILQPNKLVILSTTDVKGKTGPCGCHIPKGGLSRRASYVDSLRTTFGQVVLVDNGSFFPEDDQHRDAAPFMIDAMKTIGTDAVNVGELDLRFGLAFLKERADKAGLALVSANLVDKASRKPLFKPYVVKKVGGVTVGLFGLIGDKSNLGPSSAELDVEDPVTVAPQIVKELKAKGAQVIVLLSQLGKIEGEDLVANTEGIDAVVMGHNVSLMQRGRMVKNTVACYGGDQGHYVCRTDVELNAQRHMASAEAAAVILGPEVRDKPPIAAMVKTFEDALNARIEKEHKAVETQGKAQVTEAPAAAPKAEAGTTPSH